MKRDVSYSLRGRRFLPLAVAIGIIGLKSVDAGAIHSLVLTETSSTALAGTYDGSTSGVGINFISTDHWGVTIGFPVTLSANPQWTEPGDPSAFNVITLTQIPNQFIVNSDFFSNGTSPLADGATFFNFGTDTRDGAPISVTFNDHGDVQTVPDQGSTFALLFISIGGLLATTRFPLRGRQAA